VYKYKIVASDLDGTLLNERSEISPENLKAIDALAEKGIQFVPATGRTYSEIPKAITDHPGIRYFIYANGAVVYDRQTGKRITSCISNSTGRMILDLVNKYICHISYRIDGCCHVDAKYRTEEQFDYFNLCEAHKVVLNRYGVYDEDFAVSSYNADNIEVFSIFFRNLADKAEVKKILEATGILRTVEVSEYNLEIVNIEAGKGNALHKLADMLGVPHDATIAMGDSDNDHAMICAAGLGLAVSNSCDELKAAADEIICSNDEHALKYVLEHYFA